MGCAHVCQFEGLGELTCSRPSASLPLVCFPLGDPASSASPHPNTSLMGLSGAQEQPIARRTASSLSSSPWGWLMFPGDTALPQARSGSKKACMPQEQLQSAQCIHCEPDKGAQVEWLDRRSQWPVLACCLLLSPGDSEGQWQAAVRWLGLAWCQVDPLGKRPLFTGKTPQLPSNHWAA